MQGGVRVLDMFVVRAHVVFSYWQVPVGRLHCSARTYKQCRVQQTEKDETNDPRGAVTK